MSEEEKFHGKRKAFYIDVHDRIIFIKEGQSHKEYFNEIGHPEFMESSVRGYLLGNHMMFYKGENFEIPLSLTIEEILQYVYSIKIPIKWVGLGCNIGKVGEEWPPKIKLEL